MSTADPTLGVAAYLKADEEVNTLTEGRIFRPELSIKEDETMPRACVIVRPSGGGHLFANDRLPVTDSRLDCVSYGSTRLEAENVSRSCARALKELERSNWEQVVLYWARIAGNPSSAIDPQTLWPFSVVVVQVMHSVHTV